MIATAGLFACLALPVSAGRWGFGGHGRHDDLNPYSDGRRLTFQDGKFKLVLFSDLHYGEREGDLEWAEWGVEAVGMKRQA